VSHTTTTECALQCLCNIQCAYTKVFGLHPVNENLKLGFVEFEVRIHILEGWILTGFSEKFRQYLFELFQIEVLKNELYRQCTARAHTHADGLFLDQECAAVVETRNLLVRAVHNLLLCQFSFIFIYKYHTAKTRIYCTRTPARTRGREHHFS